VDIKIEGWSQEDFDRLIRAAKTGNCPGYQVHSNRGVGEYP